MPDEKKGSVETPSLTGFDQLSDTDVIQSLFETTDSPEQKVVQEEKKVEEEVKKTEEEEIVIPEEKKPEEKKTPEEKKSPEEEKKVEGEEDEIKLPGDEKVDDKKASEEKASEKKDELLDDESWIPVAKELGIDIKENNFEELKTAFNAKIEAAKAEVETKSKQDIISSFPIDAQLMIIGLNEGLTREQIEKPFKVIDEFLALNDTDLVARDLELEGMKPEMVEKVILKMTENDELDVKAFEIRKFLEGQKAGLKEKSLADLNELKLKNEARNKELLEKDINEVHTKLKSIPKLLESPIKEKHVAYVMEKFKKGEYQALFKNPDFIAHALLQHEFGTQAASMLAKKKFEEGSNGIVNKLHNVPPVKNGVANQPVKTTSKEESIGNFEFLKDVTNDDL